MPHLSHRTRGRRAMNEINMVPFIDVMLVLLIIFMVTAPLIAPSVIDLPSVGKASRQPDQVIQVVVGKEQSMVSVVEVLVEEYQMEQLVLALLLEEVVVLGVLVEVIRML